MTSLLSTSPSNNTFCNPISHDIMAAVLKPSRVSTSFAASLSSTAGYGGALSMADSLPSADFCFNDLRERMAQFTVRFDDFIERGRKRVLEERNVFRMNVAELEGGYLEREMQR